MKALAQRVVASGRRVRASRQAPGRVRHGLKDRFPASGMLALRAGRRRIGRRGVKGPVVRHVASKAAVIALRVGTMVNVRHVGLKVVAIVANVFRAALTANVVKALHADLKAAAIVRRVGTRAFVRPVSLKVVLIVANARRAVLTANVAKALRAGLKAAAIVRRVGTRALVHPVSLKVALIAANALRAVLTANVAKALRVDLRATTVRRVGTIVSVHLASLKAVVIAVNVLRVALTVNAAKAPRAGLKVLAIAANAHPAASKAAQIAANAHRAVSKATAPRAATKANAALSVVRARVQAVRRKVDRVASVRRVTPRIGPASAATVAPLRSAAATAQHRAVLKANVAPPSVVSALSRSPSKAATVTARTVRRAHRATTAANAPQPNVNSAIVRRVPANVTNVMTGANALPAASTRRCRLPAAALATTTAPPVPTRRVVRHRQPEPNATMTPMSLRARRVAITKTHRARCACPS